MGGTGLAVVLAEARVPVGLVGGRVQARVLRGGRVGGVADADRVWVGVRVETWGWVRDEVLDQCVEGGPCAEAVGDREASKKLESGGGVPEGARGESRPEERPVFGGP